MAKPARVLQVVTLGSATGLYGGPFDTSVLQSQLAERMQYDVILFAGHLDGDCPDHPQNIRSKFVPVRRWMPTRGFTSVFSLKYAIAAVGHLRSADLCHLSLAREMIPMFTLCLAHSLKVPVVAQTHGMLTSRESLSIRVFDRLFLLPLINRCKAVIALTQSEATALKTLGVTTRTWVLGNPIPQTAGDAPVAVRLYPVRKEALFVARLHPRKRVFDFAIAAEILAEEEIAFTVLGPDAGELVRLLELMHKTSNLHYEGAVPAHAVPQRVSETGVFVLPSINEPWGNVLALALARGVPVVVTESAALAPMITSYAAGRVVEERDPKGLADAVRALLTHDAEYASASAGALALASALLDPSIQAQRLRTIYETGLNGG